MKMRLTLLAATCAAILSSAPVLAQDASNVVGQLTNASNTRLFAGASIEIKELGITTKTQRDGTFRFKQLPVGTYTVVVTYLGTSATTHTLTVVAGETSTPTYYITGTDAEMENILVRGQRSGQASAINQQRTADAIVSIVSADAIGQFPDQNAAEALQRLPGVSIERDQGEGRFVGIRGIDPNLNNVTINGLNVPSPEGGVRSVALDVIPSELIQTLEVSKSVTADMDGDAIGGSVAVKSVSAFDRKVDTTSLTAQVSQNALRDEVSPKLSASMTRIISPEFGIAAAVSWFDRDFGSDNIESNGDDEVEQRFYGINRERLGAAFNMDFRPDFNTSYFVRTLYSKFSDDELRFANTFTFDGDDSEIERATKDRKETQTIFTITAGGEHLIDKWTLDYQVGYAQSDEDEPNALYFDFVTENSSISADVNTQIPVVSQDSDALNLSNYELDEIAFEENFTEDTELSAKFDLTRQIKIGKNAGQLQMGAKYRTREKTRDADIFIYDGDFDGIDPSEFGASSPDWGLGDFGPGFNRNGLREFFVNNRGALELAELDSEIESNGATYVNNEDIFAAYLMTRMEFDALRVVAGVRYERTDFSTDGMRVELIENEQTDVEEVVNTPWSGERNYDHLLPSINARYEINDTLIARAAFSQTISRPKFEDVAAFQIIESKTEEDEGEFVTEREAEVGNPDLKPFEADNFDLSLEYYPGDIGVLSAGYFYKSIDNFVILADVSDTPEWDGFDEVIQAVNGESADLHGIEISWVKAFENGLLISANGTFSSSDAVTLLDGERFETSLPNQSDQIGNLTLGYESDTLSLRLTMTYKSENLEEIDGDMLLMEDDHQQLDFSAKYYINDDMNVYFNAINISDEPFYNYFDQRNRNAQYEEYGRTFELGFRWQM